MHRLTFSLIVVVVSSVIGLGWGIDQWYNKRLHNQEDPVVEAFRATGQLLAHSLDALPNEAAWPAAETNHLQPQLVVYSDFPLPDDLARRFEAGEPLLLESGDRLSLHFYLPVRQQVLSLTLPPETTVDELSLHWRWLLTLLFYLGVVALVALWLYPLLKRLALLRSAAEAFGAGELRARVQVHAHSYIRDVELAFNRMAQRIEQLVADNKLLSHGLSHDLRTPLARLRFGLDVLAEADLPQQQQKQLDHLNRDLAAMEALVEALLSYARLETAQINFSAERLMLAGFLRQLTADFYRDQIRLEVTPESETLTIVADPDYLAMLCHNLIQNALHYGKGRVRMSLTSTANTLCLSVEDDGPGIPQDERERLLMPFCRGENPAGRKGHGLGLAIVERIALRHNADLQLGESSDLGGLAVLVTFTLSEASER